LCEGVKADVGKPEHDHILGLSYSPRLYQAHISIWTKDGANKDSVRKLQEAVLAGLSEDLKPKTAADYYFKRHRDHEGFEEAVGGSTKVVAVQGDRSDREGESKAEEAV
jgi:hypothetical protein